MGRRSRKSDFEVVIESLSGLPWQVCVILAVAAYVGFHHLAELQPPPADSIGKMGPMVGAVGIKTLGLFLQFLAPLALLIAALLSWHGKRRRVQLLAEAERRKADAPLRQMSWRDFEKLVGAHFERNGYAIHFTGEAADGGIDVVAKKGSEVFLVQCKQWRATQVGVAVVRELFGVMAARGATGGFVVSIGAFTSDAKAFAEGRNIELVNANSFLRGLETKLTESSFHVEVSPQHCEPDCPRCGAPMIRRIASKGPNKGQRFYGCSMYPSCKGTLSL